jgi:hypothetical protein
MPPTALSGRGRRGVAEAGTPFGGGKDPLIKRETLELVRACYKIGHRGMRQRLHEMVLAMGRASPVETPGDGKTRRRARR